MGLFSKIKAGLQKTKNSIVGHINSVINSFTKIDGKDYIIFHAYNKDCSFGGHSVDVHIKEITWEDDFPAVKL